MIVMKPFEYFYYKRLTFFNVKSRSAKHMYKVLPPVLLPISKSTIQKNKSQMYILKNNGTLNVQSKLAEHR